mmetsp:Transcript_9896/g.21527  ORF Transcript_9896/g.21527 Transcript_9896/m.21527 type:complete len:215 (-) Transcript_9896:2093-2737(-)
MQGLAAANIDIKSNRSFGHCCYLVESVFQWFGVIPQYGTVTCHTRSNESLRHQVVRQQHVFFHQSVGITNWIRCGQQRRLAVLGIQLECQFNTIQCQCPIVKAHFAAFHRHLVQKSYIVGHLRQCVTSGRSSTAGPMNFVNMRFIVVVAKNLFIDNVLCRGIVQTGAASNHGTAVPNGCLLYQRSIHVHLPDAGKGQTLHIFIQTTSHFAQGTR